VRRVAWRVAVLGDGADVDHERVPGLQSQLAVEFEGDPRELIAVLAVALAAELAALPEQLHRPRGDSSPAPRRLGRSTAAAASDRAQRPWLAGWLARGRARPAPASARCRARTAARSSLMLMRTGETRCYLQVHMPYALFVPDVQ